MIESTAPNDDIKTLEKFSKQLHMYAPDQLRKALKITIGIARDAIENNLESDALMAFDKEECLVIFPKESGFRLLPGDEVEMKVPGDDGALRVYRAKVASVKGSWKEICCLTDLSLRQQERRGAKRYPMFADAEYCSLKDPIRGGGIEKGILLNISKTGLLLAVPTPLVLGGSLTIMFEINWEDIDGVPVGIVGTVVREEKITAAQHLGRNNYCYGVRFNLPEQAA